MGLYLLLHVYPRATADASESPQFIIDKEREKDIAETNMVVTVVS